MGWFLGGVSYPCPLPYFLPDVVLVYPPRELSVCKLVLSFNCVNVSESFVYECLEFSGYCLCYSPCFLVVVMVTLCVVLVTLRVFLLLSWLLSMLSGCCHGYSLCCIGYSPCFLVVVLVTLHAFWLLSWLLLCLRAIEQHAFHIGVEDSNFKVANVCQAFPILLLKPSSVPCLSLRFPGR